MSIKLVRVEDKNLLIQAKKVFGEELVVRAWITTYCYPHAEKTCRELHENRYLPSEYAEFSVDACTILLEFSNGKLVNITSSDFCQIAPAYEGEFLEVLNV